MREFTITRTDDGTTVEVLPPQDGVLRAVTIIIVALLFWFFVVIHSQANTSAFVFMTVVALAACAQAVWEMERAILSVHGSTLSLERVVDRLHLRRAKSFQLDRIERIYLTHMGERSRPTLALDYQSKKHIFSTGGLQESQVQEIIAVLRQAIEAQKVPVEH